MPVFHFVLGGKLPCRIHKNVDVEQHRLWIVEVHVIVVCPGRRMVTVICKLFSVVSFSFSFFFESLSRISIDSFIRSFIHCLAEPGV